jgi:hypothetical protein
LSTLLAALTRLLIRVVLRLLAGFLLLATLLLAAALLAALILLIHNLRSLCSLPIFDQRAATGICSYVSMITCRV